MTYFLIAALLLLGWRAFADDPAKKANVNAYSMEQTVERNADKEAKEWTVVSGSSESRAGGAIERIVVEFRSPANAPFRRFTDEEKEASLPPYIKKPLWVDIKADLDTLPDTLVESDRPSPSSEKIVVKGDFKEPTTAARFPMFCEGNMTPTGGTGGKTESHTYWAANVKRSSVDIDVDTNRDGKITMEDDELEAQPISFLKDLGALVLVNCDKDGNGGRDMEDLKITNTADLEDMSPLSIQLKRDLLPGEELWLSIETSGGGKAWGRVMDKEKMGKNEDHSWVNERTTEVRLDNVEFVKGEFLFPKGKSNKYENRFFVEGLRFAKELVIRLEIRLGGQNGEVLDSDEVHILNTPWLANNNTRPLASVTPGNLVNSRSYSFQGNHGATRTEQGEADEFVQDSCEWGYQLRRHSTADQGRTMITALRLYSQTEDEHPLKFLSGKVGAYGYDPETTNNGLDEIIFTAGDRGDSGSNLECLPPSSANPFGRLVYGDTMSSKLRGFLERQKAQVQGGAAVIPISKITLAHVDEFICIVPNGDDYSVLVPDWTMGRKLIKNSTWEHGVPEVRPPGANRDLNTYRDLYQYFRTTHGKALDTRRQAQFSEVQSAVAAAVTRNRMVQLPGMFLTSLAGGGRNLRSFPRSIANSQPTTGGKLIVSKPRDESRNNNTRESTFYKEWEKILRKIGVTPETENTFDAWRRGGDAHRSSNTIREPEKK